MLQGKLTDFQYMDKRISKAAARHSEAATAGVAVGAGMNLKFSSTVRECLSVAFVFEMGLQTITCTHKTTGGRRQETAGEE